MASTNQLENLNKIYSSFQKIDKEKLLRPSLGEESLESTLKPKLEEINRQFEFAIQFAPKVHDNIVQALANIFESIRKEMDTQANRNNAEYVAQRTNFINSINNFSEQILQFWPPFITAAIESRGFLEDEGIKKEYQRTIDAMKKEAADSLKLVQDESSKTIEEARKLAQQIEDRARRTAAHISVEAAQKQFEQAQIDHKKQVKLWAGLSGISILAFIGVAIYLAQVKFPEEWKWHVIYYTAIRITILTAVGAVATFCLRIFRANMHMFQHNLHRQRVTNSMAAFVESAVTPEQRDLILAHLVDAVATFGTSGLLHKEDDSIHTPKMTVDNILRTFSLPQGKTS